MFSLTSSHRYYLYRKPVDMRKSFDGLCGIVSNQMNCDATSGEVYIFINRLRDKIKLLHWESGGFVLYYKRKQQRRKILRFDLPCPLICIGKK